MWPVQSRGSGVVCLISSSTQSFASCVTLSKLINLSKFPFPPQSPCVECRMGRGENEWKTQHPPQKQCSGNICYFILFAHSRIKVWPKKREEIVPRDMTSQEGPKSCGGGPQSRKPDSSISFYTWGFCPKHSSIWRELQASLVHVVNIFETNSETKLNNTFPFMVFIQMT